MNRTARITATVLAAGAASVALSGVASAHEDGGHEGHKAEKHDDNPGVLTGVGNLVGGVLASDLVGNIVDGVL